jgi:transposase
LKIGFAIFYFRKRIKATLLSWTTRVFTTKKRLGKYAWVYKVIIIFLPPYSPDYNPIEHVWANMKRFLRNSAQRFLTIQAAVYWHFATGYY